MQKQAKAFPAPQRLSVTLSREELYLILRFLHAPGLLGLDQSWPKAKSDGTLSDEDQHILAAAANALVARRYLVPEPPLGAEEMQLRLFSPVVALVGACVFGEARLLLLSHTPTQPVMLYIHQLETLTVAHTLPLPGIHQFEVIEDAADRMRLLEGALGLQEQTMPPTSVPEGKLQAEAIAEAGQAVRSGKEEEAIQRFVQGGLPAITAQMLTRTLKEATHLGVIVLVRRAAGDPLLQPLITIVSPTHCFTLEGMAIQASEWSVQAASAAAIRQWIEKVPL